MSLRRFLCGLMAVASLLAVPASAAAIGPGEFLFSTYPNKAHAVQTTKHVLTLTGFEATCKVVNLDSSTLSGPATELTLTPTYSECTAFGFGGATVATNGCTYKLNQPEGAADAWEGGFAIACPEGKKITITVSVPFIAKCKVEIGPQATSGTVDYENDTAAGEIDIAFALSGIDDTVLESTGSCPLTLGKHENATYTGGSTAEAAEGGSLAVG